MAVSAVQCLLVVSLVSATEWPGYSSKCQYPPNIAAFFDHPHYRHSEHTAPYTNGPPARSDVGYGPGHLDPRSIPVSSNVQRIQEQERRRLGFTQRTNVKAVARNENGSYKVVNKYPATLADTRRGQSDHSVRDGVVFPGPTTGSQRFIPEIPEQCKRLGICEDVPDYPVDHVTEIVARLGAEREKFKVDELEAPEIAQRIGPPEEVELCEFREKIIHPKAAPDRDGKWYYIVNQDRNPLQGFRVEICETDRSPCSKLAHFRFGQEAHCKQKYILRQMTGLDESGQMVDKPFKVPSCCSCVVRPE